MTGFGAALWLGAIVPLAGVIAASWGALTIAHALAMAATAAVVLLVTTASALLAADWRADVQSREAWAQIDTAAAELSLPANHMSRDNLDPRYLQAVGEGALRHVFQAHRFAPRASLFDCSNRESANAAAASQGDLTGEARRTSRPAARTTPAAAMRPVSTRGKVAAAGHAASRTRLVVNANAWRGWSGAECIVSPTTPWRRTADIVVLGSRRDDQSLPLRETPAGSDIASGTEPPSCRGPPQAGQRACVGTAPAGLSRGHASGLRAAGKKPAADPTVIDNLGNQVAVCAAEVNVIETYLDLLLQELLASPTGGAEHEQT
jgi:hypothetical protein